MVRDYGTDAPLCETLKPTFSSRFNPFRRRRKIPPTKYLIPVDILTQDAALHGLPTRTKAKDNGIDAVAENEGDYLKSKLWYNFYFSVFAVSLFKTCYFSGGLDFF